MYSTDHVSRTIAELSDDDLVQRWRDGSFSLEYKPIAAQELRRRGIDPNSATVPDNRRSLDNSTEPDHTAAIPRSAPQQVEQSATQRAWVTFVAQAIFMLAVTSAIYIIVSAAIEHRVPVSSRGAIRLFMEGVGFYSPFLLFSVVLLWFNKTAGWIAWVILVGLFTGLRLYFG